MPLTSRRHRFLERLGACWVLLAFVASCRVREPARATARDAAVRPPATTRAQPLAATPPTIAADAPPARPAGLARSAGADAYCEGTSSGNRTPHAYVPGPAGTGAPSVDDCVAQGTIGSVRDLYCCR